MIDARSEAGFLWRGLRALVGFRLSVMRAWLVNGHLVRRRAIDRYLAAHEVWKLHLGATESLPGFLNSQITGAVPIDVTGRFPLPDASFSLVYSSHLVEHLHRRQMLGFLAEARRILAPGGVHIIATPSAERLATTLYGPDSPARQALLAHGGRFHSDAFHTTAHQLNLTMRAFGHRFLVDDAFMRAAAAATGYSSVERIDNLALPDPALAAYIAARKPARWLAETETWVLRAPGGI